VPTKRYWCEKELQIREITHPHIQSLGSLKMSESKQDKPDSVTMREGWEMSGKSKQGPPADNFGARFPMGVPYGWEVSCEADRNQSNNERRLQKVTVKLYEEDGLVIMSAAQFERFKSDVERR